MLADWWNTLDDPLLTQLVERAVKGNLDLKLAQSRLREERAPEGNRQSRPLSHNRCWWLRNQTENQQRIEYRERI